MKLILTIFVLAIIGLATDVEGCTIPSRQFFNNGALKNSEMIKEIFKDIDGYQSYYLISNLGNVKSLHPKIGKILKQPKDKDGYCMVCLCVNQNRKSFKVHRLVAKAFIPNPQNKPNINHKNFIITDNCVSNIEWCTQQENVKYSYDNGRINPPKYWLGKFGNNNHSSKEIEQLTLNENVLVTYGSAHEAMRQTGINNVHISEVARNKRKSAGGFIWRYTNN